NPRRKSPRPQGVARGWAPASLRRSTDVTASLFASGLADHLARAQRRRFHMRRTCSRTPGFSRVVWLLIIGACYQPLLERFEVNDGAAWRNHRGGDTGGGNPSGALRAGSRLGRGSPATA